MIKQINTVGVSIRFFFWEKHACACVYVCMCICTYVYMYVCTFVCIYILLTEFLLLQTHLSQFSQVREKEEELKSWLGRLQGGPGGCHCLVGRRQVNQGQDKASTVQNAQIPESLASTGKHTQCLPLSPWQHMHTKLIPTQTATQNCKRDGVQRLNCCSTQNLTKPPL